MNIISHNCTNGRIYQMKGLKYENPFVWCIIPPQDFLYLYNNYGVLNFRKIEIEKEGDDYKVVVDGKINVYYVHYKHDETAEKPIKRTPIDVYYNKIEDYIIEKYFNRLERMKDKPIFIVTDRIFPKKQKFNMSTEDLLKYVDKEDCIVVTCDRNIIGKNVVYSRDKNIDPIEIAQTILNEKRI